MQAKSKSSHEGIAVRHSRSCASRRDGACNCTPSYQAHVWDARSSRRIRKTFASKNDAKAWRREAQTALSRGEMKAPSKLRLHEAADAWLAGARDGMIRNRSGDPFKPSVLRSYEASLRLHVLPTLG